MSTQKTKLTPSTKQSITIAVGGGKGGVGKSIICSNLAVQCAQAGCQVTLIDLDMGAANLHTIFGIRSPKHSLADFLTHSRGKISDFLLETEVPGLSLIAGSGFIPEIANLHYNQKIKLLKQIHQLPSDVTILDLGAGTSSHTVDFFSLAQFGVIVTSPEPTAVVNAYEFLKNVVYRTLQRAFREQEEFIEELKIQSQEEIPFNKLISHLKEKDSWAAETLQELLQDLEILLVLNQCRKIDERNIALKFHEISKKTFGLDIAPAAMLFDDQMIPESIIRMTPLSISQPDSILAQSMRRMTKTLFQRIRDTREGVARIPFDQQMEELERFALSDYRQTLINQRQLARQRAEEAEIDLFEQLI